MYYCTPEGGSGFITDSTAPGLPTFDMSQLSPVYDQPTGWLRQTRPGTFTNYPRFGPPISEDGGTQPPYVPGGYDPPPARVGGGIFGGGEYTLRRGDVVAPMPSIVEAAAVQGCGYAAEPEGLDAQSVGLIVALIAVGALLVGGR